MSSFLYHYFICPFKLECPPYNLVNTITYGLITAVVVYYTYVFLSKRVKFNFRFMLNLIPFIFLGSVTRVLVDAHVLPYSFWTVTPGIYVSVYAYFMFVFGISRILKDENVIPILGSIPLLFELVNLRIVNLQGMLQVLTFAIIFSLPFCLFRKELRFDRLMTYALGAHLFDACATWISMDFFGYFEKHVVPNFFISLTGTAFVMVILKLALVLPVLILVDRYLKDRQMSNFLKIVIFIMGAGTGLRDVIRLGMLI